MYIHVLTSCPNRFSWPTQRCRCRTKGHLPALLCKGGWGWRQSLSRRGWFFLCKAGCCRKRWGHQQVYQWLGEPGAILFGQLAYIAKQAACSSHYNWQQNVSCCSFGRRLSSQRGWGRAENIHSSRACIVQVHSGIQVKEYYIHVYTMYRQIMYMYVCFCTYMYVFCINCIYYLYTSDIHVYTDALMYIHVHKYMYIHVVCTCTYIYMTCT